MEIEPEQQKQKPVGGTDWFGRSVSVMAVTLTFFGLLTAGIASHITNATEVATTKYQVTQNTSSIIELKAQYAANQGQMESIRVQLALINEKLGRLAEAKK